MLGTGKLPLGGLTRKSVVSITDCPDMTLAVYHGRKALNQLHRQTNATKFIHHIFDPSQVKLML